MRSDFSLKTVYVDQLEYGIFSGSRWCQREPHRLVAKICKSLTVTYTHTEESRSPPTKAWPSGRGVVGYNVAMSSTASTPLSLGSLNVNNPSTLSARLHVPPARLSLGALGPNTSIATAARRTMTSAQRSVEMVKTGKVFPANRRTTPS